MAPLKRATDAVHWFVSELGARVVAESGIPSDRFHLGKLMLRSLKDAPDFIMQIDAATGESETFKSALERSVRCAASFTRLGLKIGDNIVLMAPNHLDLAIPYMAALYLGIGVAALDSLLLVSELEAMFKINEAKIVFCQSESALRVKEALKNLQHDAAVVTFDESSDCMKFSNFIEKYGGQVDVKNFRARDFDPVETIAALACTSGSTGFPKAASLSHKNLTLVVPTIWLCFSTFPTPTRLSLVASPLHWLSAGYHFQFSPMLRYTRLQTSVTLTPEVFVDIVNTYKPTSINISPTFMSTFTKPEYSSKCDISCVEVMLLGGSAVSKELVADLARISPKTRVCPVLGLSETGMIFVDENPPRGSLGRPLGAFDCRLVDTETQQDVEEPYVHGELWVKGPHVCKGYYNQPEASKEACAEDGWWRTGDIFYRDENYFFFYVDRLKMLMKYRNHQISPMELETVIRQHLGVLDVVVTSVPHREHGDLPVACVVPRSGHQLTAQEIKDLVKNSLTDSKQLRGGVIFMKELPVLRNSKVDRQLLKKMVLTMDRE